MIKANLFFKIFTDSKYCLLGIGAGLIAIHLTLVWQTEDSDMLGMSVLFWAAIWSLLSKKHDELNLKSDALSSLLGLFLLVFVLFKSQSLAGFDFFLRLSPLISALGLALMASGTKGLKQYWQELLILFFLIPHGGILSQVLDPSKFTAIFSTALLWYLGFPVSRQGVYVILPTGSVEVNPGCAGYSSILQLLGISIIFLLMFPTTLKQKIITPIVAALLGFIMNGIRVALLAVLAASGNQEAFTYWHDDQGSLVFSMISVLLFGLFGYFMLQQAQSNDQEKGTEEL